VNGTCAGCKHWDTEEIRSDWRFSIRVKNLPNETRAQAEERARQIEVSFGLCKAITLQNSYETSTDVPVAFTQDGSDYRADLFTQATFGCVLWEKAQGE